jgi:hypothetical protein
MADELPPPSPVPMRALFAASWRTLRAHPFVSGALGFAIVLSLASSVIGVGAIVTPWFICELFALQYSILTDRPTTRTFAWIRAGLLVLGIVGLVLTATWLAVLAFGPDVATADSAQAPLPWPKALEVAGLITCVTALTVGFIAPFQYAPLIIIDRGGRTGEALLESAWLVRRGGLARHWMLAFLAHVLPLAPAVVAAVAVARTFERAATPVGFLVGLTLVPFSVPLGQGLLSAAYFARERELPDRRWTRAEADAPLLLRAALTVVVLAPVLALMLLGAAALKPTPIARGTADGTLLVEREGAAVIHVPDTTLAVRLTRGRLSVRSGDGGGTVIGAPWRSPVERVRVLRRRDVYAIEVHAEHRWVLRVDRAGVRVDDSIAARLSTRLPFWALPAIALAFALSALLVGRALEPLGELRRAYGLPADDRAPLAALRSQRTSAVRRAWVIGAILAPTAVLALAAGLYAVVE